MCRCYRNRITATFIFLLAVFEHNGTRCAVTLRRLLPIVGYDRHIFEPSFLYKNFLRFSQTEVNPQNCGKTLSAKGDLWSGNCPILRACPCCRVLTLYSSVLYVFILRRLKQKMLLWLGRRDSNPRVTESKSVALPLGDCPM